MIIRAFQTMPVEVNINRREVFDKLLQQLQAAYKPVAVKYFDDWYIDDSGVLYGVTEHYHGSDTHKSLGQADEETFRMISAIKCLQEASKKVF